MLVHRITVFVSPESLERKKIRETVNETITSTNQGENDRVSRIVTPYTLHRLLRKNDELRIVTIFRYSVLHGHNQI